MGHFETLKETCRKSSLLGESVLDGFLLYYAAKTNKLDKEFDAAFSRSKGATREMTCLQLAVPHRAGGNSGQSPARIQRQGVSL